MAFKELQSLDAEVTTALGGRNKKTNKPNPTKAEGYFLGTRQVESKKSKTGFAKLHFLQTANGNLGVWGKTDLDRKLASVTAGQMIRITQSGKVPTPNGDMYKFKVEVDTENTIDVNISDESAVSAEASDEGGSYGTESADSYGEESYEEADMAMDEEPADVIAPARAVPPRQAAKVDAERQAKVQALLNGTRTSKATA